MKYMLMMNAPGNGPYQIASWPHEDLVRHIQFMKSFATKLTAAGELAAAEGLSGPDQAKRVRAGKDGKPITDGVFPESKAFLAGYWIVDVDSLQHVQCGRLGCALAATEIEPELRADIASLAVRVFASTQLEDLNKTR